MKSTNKDKFQKQLPFMNEKSDPAYVAPLYEGTFSVGLDKKFNPIDRDGLPEKGALKISINPFLIKSKSRNYLFDAGLGDFGENTSTETIKKNLENHHLTVPDITDIFVSHLHYDHIGGLAGRFASGWKLTFPEANVWISKKGWQKVMALDRYYDEEKTEFVRFLDAKANLHFLDDEDVPYPKIRVKKIGGHTEFSQALFFQSEQQKYLMAGDVLATRSEVNRKFAAKYDLNPKKSMKLRRMLTKKAYDEKFIIMGYHDSHHPLFRLTDYSEQKGYTITDIEAYAPA